MTIVQQKPIFDDVADWPAPANERATIGGNKPPLEELIPLEFRERLLAERPDFLVKVENLSGLGDRVVVTNDDELGRAGDAVKIIRAALNHVDETHKAVKQPYLDAGRLCDAEKNALTATLQAVKVRVEGIANVYVAKREAAAKAERDRIAAEQRAAADRATEAERQRVQAEREAADAIASAANAAERDAAIDRAAEAAREAQAAQERAALAPAAAKHEPVRSDAGATVSSKQEWMCEVEDLTKAIRAVKSDPKVKEAVEAACKRLVRAGQREIAGCRVWPVAKANFT